MFQTTHYLIHMYYLIDPEAAVLDILDGLRILINDLWRYMLCYPQDLWITLLITWYF